MQFIYTQNQAVGQGEKVTFLQWLTAETRSGDNSLHAMVKFQDGQVRGVPARLLLPIAPNSAVR